MEVKIEAKLEPTVVSWSDVCHLCLSTDRRTSSVDGASEAYGALTGCAPLQGARACWECSAVLARLLRLRARCLKARWLLEAVQIDAYPVNLFGKCMSSLSFHHICSYTVTFTSDEDFTPSSEDDAPVFKEELNIDYVSDCEVWAEAALPSDNRVVVEINVGEKASDASTTEDTPPTARKPRKVRKSNSNPDLPEVGVAAKRAKRMKKGDVIEMFVATEEQLATYRSNAFSQMKASRYTCDSCLEGFKYEENLRKHREQYHTEAAGPHQCDICACRLPSKEALKRHRAAHYRLWRCRYAGCGFVHPRSRTVRAHHALHELREKSQVKRRCEEIFRSSDQFECDYCGKAFKQRRQLAVHIKHHFKRVMCEVCGHKCSTLSQLKKHTLAHLDPSYRPFECDQCHKRFIDRHKLLLHTRIHTGERPFKCETCDSEFVSKEVLARHARERHSDGGVKERKTFSQARTKSYFINRRYIPGEEQRPLKVRRDYKVNRDEQDKFECTVCEKKLSTLAAFRTHFYVHSDKKPLKCDECDKTFKFHSQLQTHVRFLHKGEKPHQCNVCGARFALKATLNVHLSSHSNEKPFKCDQCNVTFKYKAGLWSHKLIHTGEKPHQCTICGSRFTLRGNLVGHMKTHTNERPFECNVCGRKFPWKRNLKNHFKTHAKEQQLLQLQ